jgi:hypothetical protein
MDNTSNENVPKLESKMMDSSMFSNKNTIITILVILLVFSFLGINILMVFGDFFQRIGEIIGPILTKISSTFGYTTGTVINKSSDAATEITKKGVDIADGVAHDIGDLFLKASNGKPNLEIDLDLDKTLNKPSKKQEEKHEEPKPDKTTNPIQNPISSIKSRWCLVGEYENRRGCIEVTDSDKCLSGQVFPTQQMCLNPTLTNNMVTSLKPIQE